MPGQTEGCQTALGILGGRWERLTSIFMGKGRKVCPLFFWIEELVILLHSSEAGEVRQELSHWMGVIWDPTLVSREWEHHYQWAFLMSPHVLGWKWAASCVAIPVYTRGQRCSLFKRKVKSPVEVISVEWCWGSGSSCIVWGHRVNL